MKIGKIGFLILIGILAVCFSLSPLQAKKGGGKPIKPPTGNDQDGTRFEVYLVAGNYDSQGGDAVLLTGDLGTSWMPNDCAKSFRAQFNLRAPLAYVPSLDYRPAGVYAPVILPGVDGFIDGDDIEIFADPYWLADGLLLPTGSGISIMLGKSEPNYIDSVGVNLGSWVPYHEGYATGSLDLVSFDISHPCTTGETDQNFTIPIDKTLEVRSQKGKKYVGDIYLGHLEFYYDCDQDQETPNGGGCP